MKQVGKALTIVLLLSGYVVASDAAMRLPEEHAEQQPAEASLEPAPVDDQAVLLNEGFDELDEDTLGEAFAYMSRIFGGDEQAKAAGFCRINEVASQASQPNHGPSLLRAAARERQAAGLGRGVPRFLTQKEIDAANAELDARDAKRRSSMSGAHPQTPYLTLGRGVGGYRTGTLRRK